MLRCGTRSHGPHTALWQHSVPLSGGFFHPIAEGERSASHTQHCCCIFSNLHSGKSPNQSSPLLKRSKQASCAWLKPFLMSAILLPFITLYLSDTGFVCDGSRQPAMPLKASAPCVARVQSWGCGGSQRPAALLKTGAPVKPGFMDQGLGLGQVPLCS